MPIEIINGHKFYSDGDDKPYEAEAAYYLNFQITSALSSLDHLTTLCNDGFVWELERSMFIETNNSAGIVSGRYRTANPIYS